ncbi:MAG: hypothetical protein IKT98_03900 [Selenomonadaceae bacterium]|nr:hypothetical protein [Selenomonadaceae bacterium]
MKRFYMWRSVIKSRYGVRTLVMCTDKEKLAAEIARYTQEGFTATEITKSGRFCTDGNTEIHTTVLN